MASGGADEDLETTRSSDNETSRDWNGHLESFRKSKRLVVACVFLALMFDSILLTAVVPVLPSYLHDLDPTYQNDSWPKPLPSDGSELLKTGSETLAPSFRNRNHEELMQQWLENTPVNLSYLWTDWELALNNWTYLPNLTDFSDEDYDLWQTSSSSSSSSVAAEGVFNYQKEGARIGWLFASKACVQLLANPLIGTFINRYGHGMVTLIAGVVILLTSSLLYALGEGYALMFAGRAVQGLGTSCISIAGMTLLAQSYGEGKRRSEAMGVALGGMALGVLVGYPYGGFMFEFFGKSTPFLIIAVLITILIVFLLCALSEPASPDEGSQRSEFYGEASLFVLLRDPYILLAAGALLFPEMSMALIEPTLPPWMIDTMHPQKWQLGTVFIPDSFGFFLGCNSFGIVSHRIGHWLASMICLCLMALSLFCIPLATSVWHLIVPHFGLGLALGAVDASVLPLLAQLVDTRHVALYGAVYAIAQASISLGFAVGPVAGGLLVKWMGFSWLLRGMALMNLFYAPLCYFLRNPPTKEENTAILMKENGEKQLSELYTSNTEGYSYKLLEEN